MINNELKGQNRLLLLAHADNRCTSAESEQPETRTYHNWSEPESSTVIYRLIDGILVHCLYRQKRIMLESYLKHLVLNTDWFYPNTLAL